jgi:2',3'-cyclic-nucleotide 2'-phosphodiesterase (5'-nucleotidase family)
MRFFRTGIFILVGAGLLACSSGSKIYVQGEEVIVSSATIEPSPEINSFIQPYSDSLQLEMNRVIGFATENLERGRPEGALGNFMADLSLKYALDNGLVKEEDQPICLMNHGGLRSPINKGDIRVGDIYKLMPFDNTLVVLKLNAAALSEIHAYLKKSGGEPIAGFSMTKDTIYGPNALSQITVVTTNYLALGGDKMDFFIHALDKKEYSTLLRDIIIDYVEQTDTIVPVLDRRIQLEIKE